MERESIRRIRIGVRSLTLAATLFCFGLMLWSGRPADPLWWLVSLFFMAWVFAPYALLWLASRRLHKRLSAALALLIGACMVVAFGVVFYSEGFLIPEVPDAQVGLLFLLIPPWQILLALAVWGTSVWLDVRQ